MFFFCWSPLLLMQGWCKLMQLAKLLFWKRQQNPVAHWDGQLLKTLDQLERIGRSVGGSYRNCWVLLTFGDSCSDLRRDGRPHSNWMGIPDMKISKHNQAHVSTQTQLWTEIDPVDIWVLHWVASFPYAQGASARPAQRWSRLMAGEVRVKSSSNYSRRCSGKSQPLTMH